jgi:uncharacterized protein YndB with AHSA1/START domain
VPSFTSTLAIDRSPEQVFAVLDDLDAAPRWMPSIRRIDVLTPGMAMGAGFRWRETRRIFGILRMKVVLTIVRHQRPEAWGLMFNDGKVQATATFELAPASSGTAVTFTEEVEDLRGNPKRAERMIGMMKKQDADLLQRLKAYVESTTEPAGRAERAEAAAALKGAPKPKPSKAAKKAPAAKAAAKAKAPAAKPKAKKAAAKAK